LAKELKTILYAGKPLSIIVDDRDTRGGEKLWSWIKKGVPLRIEIGPRDIAANQLPVSRRDQPHTEKKLQSREQLIATIQEQLDEIQRSLFQKAAHFRDSHCRNIDSKEEFYAFFTPKNRDNPEIHGGFAFSHWSGDSHIEEKIKEDLGVTIRCIPLNDSS